MAKPLIVEPEFIEDDTEKDGSSKTEPMLGDGDDGDDEDDFEIEVLPETGAIYRPPTLAECRRAFVFTMVAPLEYGTPEICEAYTQWLETGELPKKPKSHLKAVKDNE